MLKLEEILTYLSENKELFLNNFNIIKIGVFGSYSRNQQTDYSDIDIIIEMPKGTSGIYEKKQQLKELLKNKFNKKIDICRESAIKPLFRDYVLKETIYV